MRSFLKDFWPIFCKNLKSVIGVWFCIGTSIGLVAALTHFIIYLSEIIGMALAVVVLIFICCIGSAITASVYETIQRRKGKL